MKFDGQHYHWRRRAKIARSLFLHGRMPLGFSFYLKTSRTIFHLIKNNEKFFCNQESERVTRQSPAIKVRTLQEAKYHELYRDHWKYCVLCLDCENSFIGLFSQERFRKLDGHTRIFQPFQDKIIISKDLLFILENPIKKFLPRKKKDQLKNCIFLP